MATATVSFGLVSIPVKLFSSAESSRAVHFNQIHQKDGSRLKQQLVCAKEGTVVSKDEIVKGYEYARGQYVLFNAEEFKALEQKANQIIDITEFVPLDQVDRIYLEKAYFLGPDKGGGRAYRLLSAALRETGRAAVASYAARGKQYLVLVRPMDDGLIMEQLHYPEELRSFSEVPVDDDAKIKSEELKLAVQLISQASNDKFEPEKYRDEVRDRIMEAIEQKVAGEEITMAPTAEPEHKVIDLMAALKASVEGGKRKPARRSAAAAKAAPRKRAARKR